MAQREAIEIRETTRLAPVCSCIYCGSTDDLSDEHVVPLALGGKIILPKSTCQKCAQITSRFEGAVLRGFMMNARIVGGFPTRRPKARPKKLPLDVTRNGEESTIELGIGDYPALLHLPLLLPPGTLVGRAPGTGVSICGSETISFGKNPQDLARGEGLSGMQSKVNWDITAFARLLAKIGYGFVVANSGPIPLHEVPVLPLILGTADDASFWLGSANYRLDVEDSRPLHAMGGRFAVDPSDATKILTIARVKLFASSGATGYEVVVRRHQPDGSAQHCPKMEAARQTAVPPDDDVPTPG